MKLKEQINADFMTAFKARQMEKKTFLGLIKGTIQTEEGKGIEATDANVIKIVKKLEKSLKETIEKSNDETSKTELNYLEAYLPKMMTESELESKLHVFTSTCDADELNMKTIMAYFNSEYAGLVDNKVLNKLVRESI